jgi:hypothetical protein
VRQCQTLEKRQQERVTDHTTFYKTRLSGTFHWRERDLTTRILRTLLVTIVRLGEWDRDRDREWERDARRWRRNFCSI